MNTRWILLISLLVLALGGCSDSAAVVEESQDQAMLNPQEVSTQEPVSYLPEDPIQLVSTPEAANMPSTPPPFYKFVQIAKRDLANRLTIDIEQVSLIEAVDLIWPDASLGCPKPGKVYALGRVPGYRVRLEVNGVEYNYHMDQTGQFVLCLDLNLDDSNPFIPMTPGPTQHIGPPPIK